MSFISKDSDTNTLHNRLIGVLDVDSFECQIWLRKYPIYKGHPCVVADLTGRILSVSTEAKERGISRMRHRVWSALAICPELHVFEKPNLYEKPDTQETRKASWEITDRIQIYLQAYEKKVILQFVPSDQWYFDLTDTELEDVFRAKNVIVEGESRKFIDSKNKPWFFSSYEYNATSDDNRLMKGANFLSKLAQHIFDYTGFSLSGGVSHNLFLAKLASNLNKPNKISALNPLALGRIAPHIDLEIVPGFKKQMGERVRHIFGVSKFHQLRTIHFVNLRKYFSEDGATIIYNSARGICNVPVLSKLVTSVVNCRKNNLDINSNRQLRKELDTRCAEFRHRLEVEWERHHRFIPKSVKLEIFYCNKMDRMQEYSQKFLLRETGSVPQLAQECFQKIVWEARLDLKQRYTITSVMFSAKDFTTI